MPSKHKDSQKAIKPNPEDPCPELQFPSTPNPISRKPIFRVINCSSETRARLIQVKLWKAYSLRLDPREHQPSHYEGNIYSPMTSKTIQKAFKNLRRLYLDSRKSAYFPQKFILAQKFRSLEKLQISIPLDHRNLTLLKNSINPNLKHLCIKTSHHFKFSSPRLSWEEYLQLLSRFPNLQHLSLNPQVLFEIPQDTDFSIPKLRKLKTLEWQRDCPIRHFNLFLFHPEIAKHMTRLQNLDFFTTSFFEGHSLFSSRIPLHNIQNLNLSIQSHSIDFALFSKFVDLKSLSLLFDGYSELTIPDFSFLVPLKKFSLKTNRFVIPKGPLDTNFPKLESLEIRCEAFACSPYAFEKDLILKAPNLKALKLLLPTQSQSELFEEALSVLSLEEFSLEIQKIMIPFHRLSKSLSAFLKQNSNIKILQLLSYESFYDFLEPLVKSIQSLTKLEIFKLSLRNQLQDHRIPNLNNVISKLENLKSIHLEFPDHYFDSKELSGFANALLKCEKLEKLVLFLKFSKTGSEGIEKFVEFLKEAKRIISMKFCISGCSEQKAKELERILGYDVSLWEYPGLKISDIIVLK